MDTYLTPWKKFADFSGRATRKEFWTFYLVNTAVFILVAAFYGDGLMRHPMGISIYSPSIDTFLFAFFVAAILPT